MVVSDRVGLALWLSALPEWSTLCSTLQLSSWPEAKTGHGWPHRDLRTYRYLHALQRVEARESCTGTVEK